MRGQITAYTSGDRKILLDRGTQSCLPAVTVGATYTLSAWYKADSGTAFFLVAYWHDSSGNWNWLGSSNVLGAQSAWTQATWKTPAIPSGATGFTFGIGLYTGAVTVDDLAMSTSSGSQPANQPPTVQLTAPNAGATVSGNVAISAGASTTSRSPRSTSSSTGTPSAARRARPTR